MHVTDYYNLSCTQAAVDFVDIDTSTDNAVFIDPRALRLQHGWLENECVNYLVSFFSEVLDAIHRKRQDYVSLLMRRLGEPNETHLGYSKKESDGRGLTGKRATEFADAISRSKAAATGMLQDLEDTALFVPKIGEDLLSDMTTQIIRGPLIVYTQNMCRIHDIPMEHQYSGYLWNPDTLEWDEEYVDLPRTPEGPLILIPKSIVRHSLIVDSGRYFRGYLVPFLREQELDRGSDIVKLLRGRRGGVTVKALAKKYGTDKPSIVDQTLRFDKKPLEHYHESAGKIKSSAIVNEKLAETIRARHTDYIDAHDKIMAIAPGMAGAHYYHKAVGELLTALFYPSLSNYKMEQEIHQGRKRIDIIYDNIATYGFFEWAGKHYRCPTIPVECKNYQRDLNNPELDQMAGRFSNDRGQLGIIVCRSFENKELFIERCRDSAKDGRGFIIPLDDADLRSLAENAADLQFEPNNRDRFDFPLLRERFGRLIS